MSELRTHQRNVARRIKTDIEPTDKLPVDTATAKAYTRIDNDVEDSIVDMLINSARKEFESYTRKLLFIRPVNATFDCEGDSIMILPFLPVVNVTSVQKDGNDVEFELKGDRINISAVGEVEVIYECGLFTETVESEALLGILKFITSNFEDRQDVAAMSVTEMPNSSKKHWIKYKTFSL